jgi:adenosylcobinamide-phosphate synthase
LDRRAGNGRFAVVALTTWAVLGARSLRAEAGAVEGLLRAGDLPGARIRVTHLVGRDTATLDADEVARAAVESVAENTCDAVVAPLFWGALAGLPGLVGYRAVNTLDAMVGHHSSRYERFGWASARLDDVANFLPARACAALTALAAPTVGGSPADAARIARRDGRRHPSPNSGMAEAAFAGALRVRLGGRNVYGDRVEDRPVLGDGPAVTVADLPRVRRLSAAVTVLGAVVAAGIAARNPWLGRRGAISA